jgi:hypothetical protein
MIAEAEIDIRPGPTGRRSRIGALVYGDWAAHRHVDDPELWVLTLLPLGLNLPPDWCSFRSSDSACAAMIEMAGLRNSWSIITQVDLTLSLKAQLQSIAANHGAIEGPLGIQALADRDRLGRLIAQRPNGYDGTLN